MALDLTTPGVYREERFVRTPVGLVTGVPGFIGFGQTQAGSFKPEVLNHVDQLAERWIPPEPQRHESYYLADAVRGFFANGGLRCYVVGAGNPEGGAASLTQALQTLEALEEVDLVAVPDAMTALLLPEEQQQVQRATLAHCTQHGHRVALLDAPRVDRAVTGTELVGALTGWRKALEKTTEGRVDPANAALYFPWVRMVGASQPVPPCGHVAGIIARSDARVGVFKAPANEEVVGVVDLDFFVDNRIQGALNPEGINCLRSLAGRGLRLYGARTLSQDPQWRYVSVRRLFLTLARWIEQNMAWATFEPNTPRLWNRIQRELNVYLAGLWRLGALKGNTASDAFFVKCDAETNPQDIREQGQVVTDIGIAPTLPAEFIVVHVTHRADSIQFS